MNAEELKEHARDMKELDEIIFKLVAKHAKMQVRKLKKLVSPVRFLSAQEAKGLNLIDEIIKEPFR